MNCTMLFYLYIIYENINFFKYQIQMGGFFFFLAKSKNNNVYRYKYLFFFLVIER